MIDAPTPPPAQRRVLEWLLAYPGVELAADPTGGDVNWTHWWADEAAREDMVGTVAVLGLDERDSAPRAAPIPGPTPPITRPTFRVLRARGWVRMTKLRRRGGIWAARAWYQISRQGIAAIRASAIPVVH